MFLTINQFLGSHELRPQTLEVEVPKALSLRPPFFYYHLLRTYLVLGTVLNPFSVVLIFTVTLFYT